MDGLDWDASQLATNTPMLWSAQEQNREGGYPRPNLTSSVLNQIQEIQKSQTVHTYSNSEDMINYQPEVASTSQIMNVVPNTNLSQDAATMAVKSRAGASWGEALTSQSRQSLSASGPYTMNQISNYMPDFNLAHQQQHLINDSRNGKGACSLESFDHCLLSAANGNTDTSAEDDEISKVLSDCRNLWNFSYGGAASSGESESNASNSSGRINKDMQYCPVNELDETLFQSSSDQHINQGNGVEFNANCSKRSTNGRSQLIKIGASDSYFSVVQISSATEGGFRLISENPPKSKKPRWDTSPCSSTINFQQPNSSSVSFSTEEPDPEAIAQMKEMIYRAAAFRPVNLGLEVIEMPKRKNMRISTDPQTVAARQRRERISERIRVLQKLVPGGSKMDTASMLDEAANYLKFLRSHVKALESLGNKVETMNYPATSIAFSFNPSFPMQTSHPIIPTQIHHSPQG